MDQKSALDKIRGSDDMAAPSRSNGSNAASSSRDPNMSSNSQPSTGGGQKKKRHRGGKKRRNRRQSFIAPDESVAESEVEQRPSLLDAPRPSANTSFYRLKNGGRSSTSLESEALLDHRDQPTGLRPRRQSNSQSMFKSRPTPYRASFQPSSPNKTRRPNPREMISEDEDEGNERTPLIASSHRDRPGFSRHGSGFGYGSHEHRTPRRNSKGISPVSSRSRRSKKSDDEDYDVNNPPSVPGSPKMGTLDDVMIAEEYTRSPRDSRDAVIDIDKDDNEDRFAGPSPTTPRGDDYRRTFQDLAEKDVCYPGELSEIGEDEVAEQQRSSSRRSPRRRRHRQWPDLDILDEWSREEKEERNQEQIRAKKISEPMLVGGRLRPTKTIWHREEDDAPYRYTYFNETFDGTIHSRTISELCQFGATFQDLFKPEQPELSDSSDDEDEQNGSAVPTIAPPVPEQTRGRESREGSVMSEGKPDETSGSRTPAQSHTPRAKQKRYGPRPVFWLDVLSPTETEMKVLSKAFGIHQLTTEDIMMQEQREKVELFQNYYFVNYRSFEQDKDSDDYLEPVNMYFVVFREAVISFHFSMTPHPANVRRRIRQLNDYMSPTSDWISYAIIDDITDVYAPLVSQIEDEVDEIDEVILDMHSYDENEDEKPKKSGKAKELEYEKQNKNASDNRSEKGELMTGDSGGDMLRRVGECRKKVMSLYRLLGNKADVIKGFAKRCNEHWEVAPRSEIGLYLGDIQDHIVTMTGNLSHYENLLSRAHGNYLAQINIRMNERAEQTNDVLGKLTVLGTIVLPMNIVTGLWGMNVLVPGQDGDSLTWFWCLTGGLFGFGLLSYLIAKKLYGIV